MPHEVKYLSFEGGGGKGLAYLGALAAIQERGILNQLKGVSGSSAGAITALMISCGYSYREVRDFMTGKDEWRTDFDDFLDNPESESQVGINGLYSRKDNHTEISRFYKILEPYWFNKIVSLFYLIFKTKNIKEKLAFYSGMELGNLKGADVLIYEMLGKDNPKLAQKLVKGLPLYLESLRNHYGIFSGENIRVFFEKVIRKKINKSIKSPITFKDHFEYFNIDFKVTAVNLRTENLFIFSKDTTPLFPVSTAVRMSMSLPLIYKPVRIQESDLKSKSFTDSQAAYFSGTYVDGGLLDNAPIRVFDPQHSLLIRLGNRDQNNIISNLDNLLKIWIVNLGLLGGGSGQITPTTYPFDNVITLRIDETSLLSFKLPEDKLIKLEDLNSDIVASYFEEAMNGVSLIK